MELLLDTHTFIWSVLNSKKLPAKVRNVITDLSNQVYVSTVSFWEIAVKSAAGKMVLEGIDVHYLPAIAKSYGFEIIAPDAYDCITNNDLPVKKNHHDPFDRLLIHLAIRKSLLLVSKDSKFKQYELDGLRLFWNNGNSSK